mmetsp:Transcript_1634/g.1458  ORF Transcript_1634/g.1458 Transcript_1634/m.1458 type:complete len:84 (-) Transcript_1634:656-907(-)
MVTQSGTSTPGVIRKRITKEAVTAAHHIDKSSTRPQKNIAGLIRNAIIKGLQEFYSNKDPHAVVAQKPHLKYIFDVVTKELNR